MKNLTRCRRFIAAVATLFICAVVSIRAEEISLPPDPSSADVKVFLEKVRRVLDADLERVRREARATGQASSDQDLFEDAVRLIKLASHYQLEVVCEAAAKYRGDGDSAIFGHALGSALLQRTDYAPTDRGVVLKYLPKIEELAGAVDAMGWSDGAESTIAAGWKKARKDTRNGMLTPMSSRYAVLAARCGVTDALVALGNTVGHRDADRRAGGTLLEDEVDALRKLVPDGGATRTELAAYIAKNKSRLVFDPTKRTYRVGPR